MFSGALCALSVDPMVWRKGFPMKHRTPRASQPSKPATTLATGVFALVFLSLGAVAQEPPSPSRLRLQLMPLYDQVVASARLKTLEPGRSSKMNDVAAVDAYLRELPLSPREFLAIDMQRRRYEIEIPSVVEAWHVRWIQLHEQTARELYGDLRVNAALSGMPVDTGAAEVSRVSSGTDRNLAATFAIRPENYQGEVQVVVNPADQNQIVAAANTFDRMGGECGGAGIQAIFYSKDGGVTWGYTCAPSPSAYPTLPACTGVVFGSDPALSWGDGTSVYLNHLMLCFNGGVPSYATVVARSTDSGVTWSGHGVIKNSWATGDLEDKNFYAIDNSGVSAFRGRHYSCWDRNNDEKVAYSTDSGATWTEVDLPAPPGGGFDLGCDMAVQKDGTLHLVWDTLECGDIFCTNERMFYTQSKNGGVTWSAPVQVADFNVTSFGPENSSCPKAQDFRCIGPFGAIDIDRSGGPCDGNLYVTYADYGASETVEDTDTWVTRSTDGGKTWEPAVRANDGGTVGAVQFNPFLVVDQYDGAVVAAWLDGRRSVGNKKVDMFLGFSNDCGATWVNRRLSNASPEWNNSGIGMSNQSTEDNANFNSNQFGDYIGLDVSGSRAYVAWSDTRHFFPGFSNESEEENIAFDTFALPKTERVVTFPSQAGQDGYVLESSETSSLGGSNNGAASGPGAIRVGDSASDQEYRGILSFGTIPIPDAVTVSGVKLRIKRGTLLNTSPFSTHGSLVADVRTEGWNGDPALENADWQAGASASAVCTLSVAAAAGDWSECTWNAAGIAAIGKLGTTQVRLRFTLGDNDDRGDDYVGFFSGDASNAADRPQLVISYR